jgi:alanyl-tRNA synthetase
VNGINFLATRIEADASSAKDIAYALRDTIDNLLLVLATENEGKAMLSVLVSDNLVASAGLHAGNIVRELAKHVQGGGGGQPGFATAGGKNPAGIETALKAAENLIM